MLFPKQFYQLSEIPMIDAMLKMASRLGNPEVNFTFEIPPESFEIPGIQERIQPAEVYFGKRGLPVR